MDRSEHTRRQCVLFIADFADTRDDMTDAGHVSDINIFGEYRPTSAAVQWRQIELMLKIMSVHTERVEIKFVWFLRASAMLKHVLAIAHFLHSLAEFRFIAEVLIHTKLEWTGYRVVKKAWQYIQPFW